MVIYMVVVTIFSCLSDGVRVRSSLVRSCDRIIATIGVMINLYMVSRSINLFAGAIGSACLSLLVLQKARAEAKRGEMLLLRGEKFSTMCYTLWHSLWHVCGSGSITIFIFLSRYQ